MRSVTCLRLPWQGVLYARVGRSTASGRNGSGAEQVQRVIEALRLRQQELGLPEKDESEETPRSKVADALRYLENQKSRMHYDQYRRAGPADYQQPH